MYSVMLAFGTRPEAIKLAPVYKEFLLRKDRIRLITCVTGQHRELLDQVLDIFKMQTQHDLKLQKENQTLFHITSEALLGMRRVLEEEKPDMLIVQGDTTSAFACALAAFYQRIPVAHVEAGLRSYDRYQPFPEEVNRTFISHITDLNFCPTQRAADNLLKEQVPSSSIHVTGNTVIDALFSTVKLLEDRKESQKYLAELNLPPGRMILVTGHRRENFEGGLANLSQSLVDLVNKFEDAVVVYSVHPNPNVRRQIENILENHPRIRIIPPPDYLKFISLMNLCYFIITDSGGIQEEAPSLKKPVLIARNVTERPEAVECGAAKLVGTDRTVIFEEASKLLADLKHYSSMIVADSPFGDGLASVRIADHVENFLSLKNSSRG